VRSSRHRPFWLAVLAVPVALAATAGPGRASSGDPDPLAEEIARWSLYLKSNTSTDEMWREVKQATEPALARAEEALRDGHRLLALHRLASARLNLSASAFLAEHPAEQRKAMSALEAEWTRMGSSLNGDLGSLSATGLDGVRPAAIRALGEAALPQVRIYYDASLEYGRSTTAESGFFYLGAARAQREFAALCRSLAVASPLGQPALRPLDGELDALEGEMLAAYRPPASIDRHSEFIAASSALKEARELNGAGLRHGALLRYLQAALRVAPLRPSPSTLDGEAFAGKLRELDTRLSSGAVDHSIGRLFLELATAEKPGAGSSAPAIVDDVLPRYFAALEPARRTSPAPEPKVTVTLVRWPYT